MMRRKQHGIQTETLADEQDLLRSGRSRQGHGLHAFGKLCPLLLSGRTRQPVRHGGAHGDHGRNGRHPAGRANLRRVQRSADGRHRRQDQDEMGQIPSVASDRHADQCGHPVLHVRMSAETRRGRRHRICGDLLHPLGRDLYDDGHPLLVDDPGVHRGRQGARRTDHAGAFVRGRRQRDHHDPDDESRSDARQTVRRGRRRH